MDEGYIKYNVRWTKENIVIASSIIHQIDFWRSKLKVKNWIGLYSDGGAYGNISLKLNDKSFLISGTATAHKTKTSYRDYAIVDDFDITNNSLSCRGLLLASSEALSHAALYTGGATCIIHIHDEKLWLAHRDKLPTTDASIAYGSPEMATELLRCQSKLKSNYGRIVMGGHRDGIIAYADSFHHVFELLSAL